MQKTLQVWTKQSDLQHIVQLCEDMIVPYEHVCNSKHTGRDFFKEYTSFAHYCSTNTGILPATWSDDFSLFGILCCNPNQRENVTITVQITVPIHMCINHTNHLIVYIYQLTSGSSGQLSSLILCRPHFRIH